MGIVVYRDSPEGSRKVGRIEYDSGRNGTFQYDAHYLEQARTAGELGISAQLPLDPAPFQPQEFAPFFRGLLPEGDTYSGLIDLYQLPRNDYLALLEQLGCESIGALTFKSKKVDLGEYVPRYAPLEETRISSLVESPAREVIYASSETRLSLAGAQSKIAWFLPENLHAQAASLNDWLVPKGTAPSTHIIKLSRRGEESIAFNELACSKLSESCGFPTAKVSLIPDIPGAIAIERFDRQWIEDGGERRLLRMHQEDFCQALGFAPYLKYQPDGVDADYLCRIADLLEDASDDPVADKREFAKRMLFAYIIGNTDAHLKNSSLLYNTAWTGRRLSPMYDVTCIPLTGYSTKMPFNIGKHRELSEIDERDLLSIALDLDITLDALDALAHEVVMGLASFDASAQDRQIVLMAEQILENAKPRLEIVRRCMNS